MRGLSILESVYCEKAHHHGGERIAGLIDLKGPNAQNVENIEKALLLLQQRHPALRMRMDFTGAVIRWEEDENLRIPIKVTTGDKFEEYLKVQKEPLKTGEGIARILLINGDDNETSTLIPMMEHFSADGVSYLNFCHELILGMSGSSEFTDLVGNKLEYAEPSYKLGSKGYDGKTVDKLKSMAKFFSSAGDGNTNTKRPKVKASADDKAQPQIQICDIVDENETKNLFKACKLHSTSITGLIGAVIAEAYAQTLSKRTPSSKKKDYYSISQNTAFDMRRFYKPPLSSEHISFHVSVGSPLVLKVPSTENPEENTWKNAVTWKSTVTKHVKEQRPMAVLLLENSSPIKKLGQPIVKAIASTDRVFTEKDIACPQDLFLTNWGRVPIREQYDGIEVLNFLGGCNEISTKHVTVVMWTFRGRLGLSALGSKYHYEQEFVQEFLDKTVHRLETLASSNSE
mmetsp:Transcript_10705/g.12916  ORF Transcript_10705/g.12916 Transcript_10705/m.12916 type:complete len:457 (-) Transcript_10705:32-1402(-)